MYLFIRTTEKKQTTLRTTATIPAQYLLGGSTLPYSLTLWKLPKFINMLWRPWLDNSFLWVIRVPRVVVIWLKYSWYDVKQTINQSINQSLKTRYYLNKSVSRLNFGIRFQYWRRCYSNSMHGLDNCQHWTSLQHYIQSDAHLLQYRRHHER